MIFPLLFCFIISITYSSTIGIATGSATVDNRPILFKNKDNTSGYPADVDFYQGNSDNGHYSYVFQLNENQNHTRARMGINNQGFGIVYTDSENLHGCTQDLDDNPENCNLLNGYTGSQFTAWALKTCSSIEDFLSLLNSTQGERKVHQHFAVIDSTGRGGLFEVDGVDYVHIEIVNSIGTMANTAKYHPNAGNASSGSTSAQREERVNNLMNSNIGQLNYKYFINDISKDFSTTQLDENIMPQGEYETNAVLSRYKTTSACVIKGAKSNDIPLLYSSMWVALGEPSYSLFLPTFPEQNSLNPIIGNMTYLISEIKCLLYDCSIDLFNDMSINTNLLIQFQNQLNPIQNNLFSIYDNFIITDYSNSELSIWSQNIQSIYYSEFNSVIPDYFSNGGGIYEITIPHDSNPNTMGVNVELTGTLPNYTGYYTCEWSALGTNNRNNQGCELSLTLMGHESNVVEYQYILNITTDDSSIVNPDIVTVRIHPEPNNAPVIQLTW